ncbi:MAG TPA: type II and III secretion system protein family protein [Xanthobacteraceae bacterium]|nr:type II and III secretion system protein family protein [Xanthobacteraceae bacterium]
MKRLQARPVECRAWRGAEIFGALIAAIGIAAAATLWPIAFAQAADSLVVLGSGQRTESIVVPTGKSQNIRTDTNFVDVVVGDPEIADVMPLTDRSLSILGKKIGTTRVSVYAEGKKLIGVFDIEVSYDVPKLAAELRQRFPRAQFRVSSVNGRIMLSGICPDGPTLDQAVTIARQFGPDVINSVQVLQAQQVLLEVRFVEIQRTAARELGIQWDLVAKNVAAAVGQAGLISGNPPFGSVAVIGGLLAHGVHVDAVINALEQRDVARRLAEPNLVALSGDTASFLAGGEFPFPVSSSLGQITIEFKRFGVGLAFTPTVLSNGVINLKIEPEVSQLDPTNVITVSGTTIPSLIVRRANTTVELRDGQSFAIGGLLQNNVDAQQKQLPWLGSVPVLGALFRSALYQKKETDLVIIVTPHIVQPMRPGDVARVPTDDAFPGNDADVFLLGEAEITPSTRRRLAGVEPPLVGHILDLGRGPGHAAQ